MPYNTAPEYSKQAFTGHKAIAYDCEVDGIYYDLDNSKETASVTFRDDCYNSYSGAVTIPESITYNGSPYSVTSIGNYAFTFCSGLTEIVSLIEEPFAVSCWDFVNKDIPLYIPKGTKELY